MSALTRAARKLARPYRVTKGSGFRLKDFAPDETRGLKSKRQAQTALQRGIELLAKMQEKLYAQDRWSLLLVFQAMDAAGKDGTIEHVMTGVNPQGCQVYSFKQPSAQELDHDFLWRTAVRLPERGRIGVFNRSYYEEVLVVRVHPELLQSQRLPARAITRHIWDDRLDDIKAFERHLTRNGYVIRKFFLHVSKREQARRFLARLDEPDKRWKFSLGDIRDRERWPDYMRAYERTIRATSTAEAPWIVVPADRKWFARLVIAGTILGALKDLKLKPPAVSPDQEQELAKVRAALAKSIK